MADNPCPVLSPDEDGGSGEESGSGCDTPSCAKDQDMYFSTPPNPRVDPVVVRDRSASGLGVSSQGSVVLALFGLVLALLAPHWR